MNELLIENDVSASIGTLYGERERIIKQIDAYLCTPTTPNIEEGLKNFPIIHRLYLKFNCIRSSEAVCERMFSYAGKFHSCFFLLLWLFVLSNVKMCNFFYCDVPVFSCLCLSFLYIFIFILIERNFQFRDGNLVFGLRSNKYFTGIGMQMNDHCWNCIGN